MKTILVAGCGGSLGIGIARILKMEKGFRLIGTDIHARHPGAAIYDECLLIPRVGSGDAYLASLTAIVEKYDVQAIIPLSPAELTFFSGEPNRRQAKCPLVLANEKALTTGVDKYATAAFLRDSGLPYPWTVPFAQGGPLEFPCILKPRAGSGSKGVRIVREMAAEYEHADEYADYIWQEFLADPEEEYTCGLFRSSKGDVRSIVLRRELDGSGMTARGEVVHDAAIGELLAGIAEGLALEGSINVQLRVTAKGPMVFEINPRFSSTVVFRHLLGFKDLLWSIDDRLGIPLEEYQAPPDHTVFYRIAQEIILPPAGQ